ncbi:hypothetical protein [Microcoleus sp. B3-D7]|uniref:hypothetical protein n=1 Tax=Microcoleus sp. B3-D7 TaxID=2818659 RepID=UPI002FCF0FCC
MMTDSLSSIVLLEEVKLVEKVQKVNLVEKVKKTKRTLTLSEEIDRKVRLFAANRRIPVGSLVEAALIFYFSQNLEQENTEN